MKQRSQKNKQDNRPHPHPIRFDAKERQQIDDLVKGLGISTSEIVRMAVRFALPKFLSGEVSIKDLAARKAA